MSKGMATLLCDCCGASSGVPSGPNENRDLPDNWHRVCSVRNGLELLYVCPKCGTEMAEHVKAIADKFPEKHRDYLYWTNLLTVAGLREKKR